MKKRFTEAQIVGFLREADAGLAVKDLCRTHGFSEASYYPWPIKPGGMSVSDAKRLKELETENSRLKRRLAESLLEQEVPARPSAGSGDRTGPPRAGAEHDSRGLSERHALAVLAMSASALRYTPAPDRNARYAPGSGRSRIGIDGTGPA
jgi:hypothetical protein